MKLSKLLFSIGIVLIAVWLLNIIFKVTFLLVHFALFVGGILIIAALLQRYAESKRGQ